MKDKDGLRHCDRCGVHLTKDNNKCGYELCDKCNEELDKQMSANDTRADKCKYYEDSCLYKRCEDCINTNYTGNL